MRQGSAYVFRLTAAGADRLQRRLNDGRPVDGLRFESLAPESLQPSLQPSGLDARGAAAQHDWLSYGPGLGGIDGAVADYRERIRPGAAPASLRLQQHKPDRGAMASPMASPLQAAHIERARWITHAPFPIELRLDRGRLDRTSLTSGAAVEYIELLLYAPPFSNTDAVPLSSRRARDALLALALRLNRMVPLLVQVETAIQAALRDAPSALRPIKYRIAADSSAGSLCRNALVDVLKHWLANQDGVRLQRDIEFTHQLRVALRRLATAFKVFRPQLPADWLAAIEPELRWLRTLLGSARDWDVFIDTTLPAIGADLGDRSDFAAAMPSITELADLRAQAISEQSLAHEAIAAALASARYAHLILMLLQGVAALDRLEPHGRARPAAGFRRQAKHWLRKNDLGRRGMHALAAGAEFRAWPAERQHKVRLRAKRMRYALEFLAPLLRAGALRRARRRYAALLDALGGANDAAVAARLAQQLQLGDTLQDYTQQWLATRRQASLQDVERHLPRLRRARLKPTR